MQVVQTYLYYVPGHGGVQGVPLTIVRGGSLTHYRATHEFLKIIANIKNLCPNILTTTAGASHLTTTAGAVGSTLVPHVTLDC